LYLGIGTPSREKNVVRMPINTQYRTPNRLLEVLANPPIALLIKRADTDCSGTGATGKLVFVGGPADKGCCPVETEENERGFPGSVGLGLPDVCVALQDMLVWTWLRMDLEQYVLGTSDDAVGFRGPVNARNELVMLHPVNHVK
jgi:hypothetical protein